MEASPPNEPPSRAGEARARTVHIGGEDHAFAEITPDQARAQAAELKSTGTFGPLQRVAKVAMAWGELAGVIEAAGASTVGELDDETVLLWAERVWVIAPEGGMI
ncbi:MAG: hypothetical protein ACR2G3_02935 [Solirubrobacterales bacterium]